MREAWNERARRDPFLYVETAHWDGDVETFFALGEERCRLLVDPVLSSLGRPASSCEALDLGCGLGRISRALARRFAAVLGVDVSDEMVSRATELHPRDLYPNLRFSSSDGLTLPVQDESFDFAFSYEVLQHMPSHEVIVRNLQEVRRVLRPQGLALVHIHTTPTRRLWARARLARLLPESLVKELKVRVLGQDPLVSDATFRGSAPFARGELALFFARAGLHVVELRDDPTHPPGSRAFVLASR
jgi:SAM-dependent methyltransferase